MLMRAELSRNKFLEQNKGMTSFVSFQCYSEMMMSKTLFIC